MFKYGAYFECVIVIMMPEGDLYHPKIQQTYWKSHSWDAHILLCLEAEKKKERGKIGWASSVSMGDHFFGILFSLSLSLHCM